ncbi:hypothetical protein FJZ28_00655 [Candidatus Peregrinibacteria bacterium]|nr:hypothetical protein [Candidatus Peregrinibacteria bacterium]
MFANLLHVAILVLGGAAFIYGIAKIKASEKDHHETCGIFAIVVGTIILMLNLDSDFVTSLRNHLVPQSPPAVVRYDGPVTVEKATGVVSWTRMPDNVQWIVVSMVMKEGVPAEKVSQALPGSATNYTVPPQFRVKEGQVEKILVFYGTSHGPSGEAEVEPKFDALTK